MSELIEHRIEYIENQIVENRNNYKRAYDSFVRAEIRGETNHMNSELSFLKRLLNEYR